MLSSDSDCSVFYYGRHNTPGVVVKSNFQSKLTPIKITKKGVMARKTQVSSDGELDVNDCYSLHFQ